MTKERKNRFLLSLIICAVIYSFFLMLFIKVFAPKRIDKCVRCKQAIANYINSQKNAGKQPRRQYSQSGVINKEFKQMVSRQEAGKETPQVRAYQQQLAEYRLRLEEQKQRELERQRQEQKEEQERIALIEQERQERLKQQALQKNQNTAVSGALSPSKSFTAPKTSGTKVSRPATQQKTQIGTLKTSKLGESSFQK